MPKQGIRLSTEAIHSIRAMLEQGLNGTEIARKLGVSKNTICYYIKRDGMRPMNTSKIYGKPRAEVADCFSDLPDSVLFDAKRFPSF